MSPASPDAFSVTVASTPVGADVLTVRGELDLYSREWLDKAAVAAAPRLVVDLCDVSFIDSAGIHALMDLRRHATDGGGWLRLVYRRGQQIDRVLAILGLTDLFVPYDDVAAALAG